MRIAIDFQCAQNMSRKLGIGRYCRNLVKAMIRESPADEFFLLLNTQFADAIADVRSEFAALLPQNQIIVYDLPGYPYGPKMTEKQLLAAELVREEFIRTVDHDVLLIGGMMEDLSQGTTISSVGLLPARAPVAVIVHDFIPLVFKNIYLQTKHAELVYQRRLRNVARADLLLTNSHYTAEDSRRYLKDFRGAIANIQGGVSPEFLQAAPSTVPDQTLLLKLGLNKPFVLYVSSYGYHKNQKGLIESFARLPLELRKGLQLVLCGFFGQGVQEDLRECARRNNLPAPSLVLADGLQDRDVVTLYKTCRLYICPSLYEGLGLTALEAMACGAPVLAANNSSLPEFLPDSAMGFDPFDKAEMTERLRYFLSDAPARERIARLGREHARQFTWSASARLALRALRNLARKAASPCPTVPDNSQEMLERLGRLGLNRTENRQAAHSLTLNEALSGAPWTQSRKRKIGWVTPWNKRCGIARYAKFIIDCLPVKPLILAQRGGLENFGPGYDVLESWREGFDSGDDLRSLGELILANELTEVMIQHNFGFFTPGALAWLIRFLRERGLAVFITMHCTSIPQNERLLSEIVPALQSADALFVHQSADFDHLARYGLRKNVRYLPHGFYTYPQHADTDCKIHAEPFVVATYGFCLPHKGLPQVIEAVALLRSDGLDVRLRMVNADYGEPSAATLEECRRCIAATGMTEYVELITDFLDDAESVRRLRQADVLVFAYQNTEESASGALRIGLTSGVLTAVTPLPIFDDLREAVITLPGVSPHDIAAGLRDILNSLKANPAHADTVVGNAQRQCEINSFSNIASYLDQQMSLLSLRPAAGLGPDMRRQLLLDVSNIIEHDDGTGIQRVVRGILANLLKNPPHNVAVRPVRIRQGERDYSYAPAYAAQFLKAEADMDAVASGPIFFSPGDVFLGLDWCPDQIIEAQTTLQKMRQAGVTVRFYLHDLLPLTLPGLFETRIQTLFTAWFDAITAQSDGAVCVSRATAEEARKWIATRHPEQLSHFHLDVVPLGADIDQSRQTLGLPKDAPAFLKALTGRTMFLMVGRIEVRKQQELALRAMEKLWAEGVAASLVLVGSPGWDTQPFQKRLQTHPQRHKQLFWLQGISDEYLQKIYERATAVLMPNLAEGFGLPLIEAARYGVPIIARDIPVFREIADEHAYFFSGDQPEDLASAIKDWLVLHAEGRQPQSKEMPYLTWAESAERLKTVLFNDSPSSRP